VLLQNSLCEHAITNTPADLDIALIARFLPSGSLPRALTGSASALQGFGICSVFIYITACSLANPL
jgi:hypothetical protein